MSFIPKKCKFIFEKLENRGYECFAVGGCVRDAIMGVEPADWDFTTNAQPDEILDCFDDYTTVDIGKRFGTICVVSEGESYEITTYRNDGEYSDSRHPDSVQFSEAIEEDLARRDFTINSIAYSEERGFIDPYGGKEDIENKIIRCTGEADLRFQEDALRILRAIRFSSRLGFSIEPSTASAIHAKKDRLSYVHPQRIRKELLGILMGSSPVTVLREFRDALSVVIPEIEPMFDLAQNNPHHVYDVWMHTLHALDVAPKDEIIRLAVFFHDIGKPHAKTTDDKGIDHFKKHPYISEKITRSVLTSFGFSSKTVSDVCKLVRFHDERFRGLTPDIKRVLGEIDVDLFQKLLQVSRADMLAQSDYQREEKLSHHRNVEAEFRRIMEAGECYSLSQLEIKGTDLLNMGFTGEAVGHALDVLLKSVIKGRTENDRDALMLAAKSLPRRLKNQTIH